MLGAIIVQVIEAFLIISLTNEIQIIPTGRKKHSIPIRICPSILWYTRDMWIIITI